MLHNDLVGPGANGSAEPPETLLIVSVCTCTWCLRSTERCLKSWHTGVERTMLSEDHNASSFAHAGRGAPIRSTAFQSIHHSTAQLT